MKSPRDDGLRSTEEADAIFDYQDALVAAVEELADGILWGLRIFHGSTTFAFYLPAGHPRETGDRLRPIVEIPGYTPEKLQFVNDPEWKFYSERYPDDFHRQCMRNREVQLVLEDAGDSLTKRRRIDHVALFATEQQARQAIAGLKRAKFRGFEIATGDPAETALSFHRKNACDGTWPDAIMAEILDEIEPWGGRYDGWGCLAQT